MALLTITHSKIQKQRKNRRVVYATIGFWKGCDRKRNVSLPVIQLSPSKERAPDGITQCRWKWSRRVWFHVWRTAIKPSLPPRPFSGFLPNPDRVSETDLNRILKTALLLPSVTGLTHPIGQFFLYAAYYTVIKSRYLIHLIIWYTSRILQRKTERRAIFASSQVPG